MSASPERSVRYPSAEWFRSAPSWLDYHARGFREAGFALTVDPSMDQHCRSELGFQVTTFDVTIGGTTKRIAFDWCDFDAEHFDELSDHGVDRYFKIGCLPEHVAKGIRPIGQTVSRLSMLDRLDDLRALNGTGREDVVAMFRATGFDIRTEAVRIIRAGPWNALAGVAPYPRRPPVPVEVAGVLIDFDEHLRRQAAAKVCVALPGVGIDVTWRHTELWAMGAAMITVWPDYVLPGPWQDAAFFCRRDLADLADVIARTIADDDGRRSKIAANGRRYFDEWLSPAASVRYMIRETFGGSDGT